LLPVDPFEPRPVVNEFAASEPKTEPVLTPTTSATPPVAPGNSDPFVRAAATPNESAPAAVPTNFGFATPDTKPPAPELAVSESTLSEPLSFNETASTKPIEEMTVLPILPKESESTAIPFVSGSVPAVSTPPNPLRHETGQPATDTIQTKIELPKIDAVQTKTEQSMIVVSDDSPKVIGESHEVHGEVNEVRGEVNEVRGEVHEVHGEVHEIRGDVHEVRGDVHEVRGEVNEVHGEVHEVRGESHEVRGGVPEVLGDAPEISIDSNNSNNKASSMVPINTEPTTEIARLNTELHGVDAARANVEPAEVEAVRTKIELPETDTAQPVSKNQPFDPIAVNGELFVDWQKPKLLLVFTGFMNGYVEPCGCAGLEQMKGGLSRRYTFFKELEEKKGWSVLPIDAGNLNKGFGRQEELKFNFVIDEALRLMKYQATGIGDRELLLPTDALILYFVDVPGIPRRYTSANVAIMQFDPDFTAPYRVFEQNGIKVGVTSVIGQSLLKDVNNNDIQHDDAIKRLKEILPQFAAEKCDKRVLIIHGSGEETKRIVKAVPGQFDYIIPSDTPAEPPFRPNWIENSMLVEVGEKGKFAVAIGLYDDPNQPYRYQRVPLDSRFENSKTIVALMQLYQEQLRETGFQGLGIKPIPNRRAAETGHYLGSKSCADCHELSFRVWKKSRHATAWRSLAETSKPSRTFDPECIACHVVGWNPAEFLPYEHGFMGEKETPQLLDVGCESCHGPGENHIQAEQGSDAAFQEKLRKSMRLPLNTAKKVCLQCHDGDNSPHFDFDTYWSKIVHKEEE
ncbi:MAG: hypothetical protein LBQ50_02740, partial [Planctomycetaceae bacterium]|jgi:archaellum component FlaC|nr:hypothetical protein [Planctomycetaceae bacterium]